MKILLLNFDSEKSATIQSILRSTDSLHISEILIEHIPNQEFEQLNFEDTDIILFFVDNNIELTKKIAGIQNNYPIIYISGDSLNYKFAQFNIPPFRTLSFNELTPSVLKNYIPLLIELSKRNRLLKRREAEFQFTGSKSFFENPLIGIYETDSGGTPILMNKKLIEILGYSNLNGLPSINLFNGKLSEKMDRFHLLKNLKYSSFMNNTDEWRRADDSKVHVNEFIKKTKSESGDIIYQGLVIDMSDIINTKKELLEMKFEAEKSENFKIEFLTQISHEIRTPVNTLLNYVSLVKSELSDQMNEPILESFRSIDSAGKRIVRTIDLLVKISELTTNNYKGRFQEYDLAELLEEIVRNHKSEADQKNIRLKLINQLQDSNLIFDHSSVYDIFNNLLDNAVKYTSEGGVTVYLKPSIIKKISVVIKDTGAGISPDYLSRIFKPFSQETSGYTRRFDGNGVGLSLVKEYCRINNADIYVCSEKGTGSEFTVIFN